MNLESIDKLIIQTRQKITDIIIKINMSYDDREINRLQIILNEYINSLKQLIIKHNELILIMEKNIKL